MLTLIERKNMTDMTLAIALELERLHGVHWAIGYLCDRGISMEVIDELLGRQNLPITTIGENVSYIKSTFSASNTSSSGVT
ncbi:hypothetical protein GCM10027317_42150 [Massilia agri]